jgi:hypothetical protein
MKCCIEYSSRDTEKKDNLTCHPHYISREMVGGSIHENEEKDIRKGHAAGNYYLKYISVHPFIFLIAHQLVQSPKMMSASSDDYDCNLSTQIFRHKGRAHTWVASW